MKPLHHLNNFFFALRKQFDKVFANSSHTQAIDAFKATKCLIRTFNTVHDKERFETYVR